MIDKVPSWLQSAREHWKFRGVGRPAFACTATPSQESVWDYPRPPALASELREVVITWGSLEVARTRRAVKLLETSHPPGYYLPWQDVARHLMEEAPGGSFCEWKGPARYWTLVDGQRRLDRVAWSYPAPLAGAEVIADCVAFYPTHLVCTVGGVAVTPQPSGFYGGWITPELVGPFKGEPGSSEW